MKIQFLSISFISIILLCFFTFYFFQYFKLLNNKKYKFKYSLLICRFSILLLLFILVVDPWVNWKEVIRFSPNLNIYLDNSKSMGLLISSNSDFNKKIELINKWSKDNNLAIYWHLFGDSTREFSIKDEILFSDTYSSIEEIENNILLNNKTNHLIITDGHINKGVLLDDFIVDNDNIYIAGVGNEIQKNDFYISKINYNNLNKNIIDIIVTIGYIAQNLDTVSIDLTLKNYNNKVVSELATSLNMKNKGFSDIVFKNINANDIYGINNIRLESRVDELNYNNNIKYFIINEQKLHKILLLSGGVSNNTKLIKNIINNSFNDIVVDHYFDYNKIDYNVISNYSLLILDNFPSEMKDFNNFSNIVKNKSDIPIIYFEGPGLKINLAEKIAKLFNMNVSLNDEFENKLNLVNNSFIFDNLNFNRIPPIKKNILWKMNNDSIKVMSSFSNNTVAGIKEKNLSGVFIPNLASINLIEENLFNSNNLTNYIINLISYEYESIKKLIHFNINKIDQFINIPISTSIIIDKKIANLDLYMNINNLTDNSNDIIKLEHKKDGEFNYNFVINNAGVFNIELIMKKDELEDIEFKSNQEYVVVNDYDMESQFLYQNKESIFNFISKNNGFYFDFKDIENNLNKINLNQLINIKQNNINSLSTQYYWIILILLLSIEWYLRKKNKLL